MTTIGFIGAGHIGSQVALAVANAGYDVILSNSRGPDSLLSTVADIPRSRAGTIEQATGADLIIIAVPLAAFATIPAAPLVDKTVLVTTNYNPPRDSNVESLDDGTDTVPGLLQKHLAGSHVVRAFSMISSSEVPTDGLPSGDPQRRALAIAGDDAEAKASAAKLYDDLGFDTVDLGGLDEAWRVDRGQKAFVAHQTKTELEDNARNATRNAH